MGDRTSKERAGSPCFRVHNHMVAHTGISTARWVHLAVVRGEQNTSMPVCSADRVTPPAVNMSAA